MATASVLCLVLPPKHETAPANRRRLFRDLRGFTAKIPEIYGAFKVRGIKESPTMNNRPAYYAGQSDPTENRQFRRRWADRDGTNSATVPTHEQHPVVPLPALLSPVRARAEREWQDFGRKVTP